VGERIVRQLATGEERIDQREPGAGTVAHRDGRRAIELDDR
jgi:hypothetical protein